MHRDCSIQPLSPQTPDLSRNRTNGFEDLVYSAALPDRTLRQSMKRVLARPIEFLLPVFGRF
jgi:hypothetical protein